MNEPVTDGSIHWRRIALGGGGGMLVGMGLGRFSFTAMVPALVEAGQLTAVQAGRVGMLNLLGFFLGAAASAPLQRAFGARRVLFIAAIVSWIALVASAAPLGFAWLGGWRWLVGLSTGLIMALSLALVAATVPAARRTAGASYMFAGVGIGILIAGVVVPRLLSFGLAVTWIGLAAFGFVAMVIALWGWTPAQASVVAPLAGPGSTASPWVGKSRSRLVALLLAHFLFSMSIVPHTLYWVDYLSRGLGLGIEIGGLHWSLVGIMSIIGPAIATWLAARLGAHVALVLSFILLAAGIAAPAMLTVTWVLVASTVVFGAQPGVAALLAARVRDFAEAAAMPVLMSRMILANASGAVAGGLLMPWLYGTWGSHAPLFVTGGAAVLIAALLTAPGGGERR